MPTLVSIESDYSLPVAQERNLFHELRSAKSGGYFRGVWIAHPFNPPSPGTDPRSWGPRFHDIDPDLCFVEGCGPTETARFGGFAPFYFLLGQVRLLAALTSLARKHADSVVRAGDPYYLGLLAFCVSWLARRPLVIRIGAHYDALYEASGVLAYPRLLRRRALEQRVARFVLKRADLVMAATQHYADFASANGATPESIVVTRFGSWVDPIHWREETVAASTSLRTEFEIPMASPIVALASRLEPLKYVEDVVEAFRSVVQARSDAVLVVAGTGSMDAALKARVDEWGIAGSTRFVGARDQPFVQRLFREAAVIASPLAGRALVEAMLSGSPVVVYDCDWHGELVVSGRNGVVVPFRDRARFADAIVELIEDESGARSMGRAGRSSVATMMDTRRLLEVQVEGYARLETLRPGRISRAFPGLRRRGH